MLASKSNPFNVIMIKIYTYIDSSNRSSYTNTGPVKKKTLV
jgi:hypothetical protein